MKARVASAVCLFLLLLSAGCGGMPTLDSQLDAIVQPHAFNLTGWEVGAVLEDMRRPRETVAMVADTGLLAVKRYFALAEEARCLKSDASQSAHLADIEAEKETLEDRVRSTLSRQVGEVLAEEGIYNPFQNYLPWKVPFPPVYFRLEEPPNLLVISPRDRIEYTRGLTLDPGTRTKKAVEIESSADALGVSSLVVPLGGMATYPSFVVADYGLRFAIDVVTEEWLHQYLTFKPLGLLYTLHLAEILRNPEIATLDETVASIAAKEIGDKVYRKYYLSEENKPPQTKPAFDFNREMREIRKAVDTMLARGEVEAAERFMNEKRDFLATKGYNIRKLNQAYFAFYGTYADSPTSVDPLGAQMRQLREQSGSLSEFLNIAGSLTSRAAVEKALERN